VAEHRLGQVVERGGGCHFSPNFRHPVTLAKELLTLDDISGGRVTELGIDELVIHWPVPDSIFENDLAVFERIATEGLAQLA